MRKPAEDVVAADAAPRRGRPRDDSLDDKIRKGAISLFAARGWSGFSMEQVTKEAGVGKGSVYLRWGSATDLLLEALQTEVKWVDDPDTGTLRDDLMSMAKQLLRVYASDNGRAFFRIYLEGDSLQGFEDYYAFQQEQNRLSRQIIRRGVERGELPPDTRVAILLDALCGGLMMHTLTAPPQILASERMSRQVCEDLVNLVLGTMHSDRSSST
jgi:AcrR family transcriptional regulator